MAIGAIIAVSGRPEKDRPLWPFILLLIGTVLTYL